MTTLQQLVGADLGIGLGLRSAHYATILGRQPAVDWFEILSENYLHTGGRPVHVLDEIAAHYPIAMHGVSMNIGGTDPLDRDYLRALKALQQRCRARWISDHLCWTGVDGKNLHDLLPLPYTKATLRHLSARVRQVQDLLEQPLVLENPSTYVTFARQDMDEPTFLRELCTATGCGLLLDVNNTFVCASNHGFDAEAYLRAVPWQHVVYFHLAGHTTHATHKVDTHDRAVSQEVWRLYRLAHELSGGRSTLLEWDADIPDFATVHREAKKALRHRAPAPAARRAKGKVTA
ncbi:MAG: DUF692 domain-containing protein [Planctomycetes bacterium]|nr:DUF692 domain-containing protein [Planctomycetota bacterium]MCC7395685.1 DUF692 domain-containing protein [Planctomycetota bacterium]